MNNRLKNLKWNTILALVYQILIIITGLIIPRLFLKYYSSEVYGLLSSITQFLSFINLADFGISAVISSSLYKPLTEKDNIQLSKVFNYSRKFFRIISIILIIYVISLIIIYPVLVKESFSIMFTASLILAMSVSYFGQYFIGVSHQILLNADQKSYIQIIINAITLIINTIAIIIIMKLGFSIQIVKLITSIIYLLRPLLMGLYVKKHYSIDKKIKAESTDIPNKYSGIMQHISYIIYENTDVVVLTIFSTLSNVSIYSIYTLIVGSIRSLINASTTGVMAYFGNIIASNEKEKLKKNYEVYDWIIHTGSVMLFFLTSLLIVPFILLYTSGVKDINYDVKTFSILITIAYGINIIRNSMNTIIKAAGHFKQTQMAALFEAVINVIFSIALVFKYGLIGVAIGTIISTTFFTFYQMLYLSKNIVYMDKMKYLKQLLVDILSIIMLCFFTSFINIAITSYFSWIFAAIIYGLITFTVILIINLILYKNNTSLIYNQVRRRFIKKSNKLL